MISSNWKIYIGLILVALSAAMGVAHYAIFGDARTLLFYLALDVVFVPVQVLFVTLIIAVFHLTEELAARTDIDKLSAPDLEHIYDDINRAFGQLISEWLEYMKHLKAEYPYLYSLAVRTNPFNPLTS